MVQSGFCAQPHQIDGSVISSNENFIFTHLELVLLAVVEQRQPGCAERLQRTHLRRAGERVGALEAVAAEIAALGGEAALVPADVSTRSGVRGAVDAAVAAFGGLDLAFDEHNAKLVSADMKKKVDAAKADIISGKIQVVDYMTANKCN